MLRKICLYSIAALIAIGPVVANAIPMTYSFSTGTATVGPDALSPLFAGLSVSGTFDYDPATPSSGTVGAGITAGSTLYSMSNTNLVGSVGGWSFSDLIGGGLVGDERYVPLTSDILALSFRDVTSAFDVIGLSLLNVRLFWIEGQLGITGFLSNQNLPGVLPSF